MDAHPSTADLPVVVIGAGPQGLAAAAHLLERGLTPLVLEQGEGIAAAVAQWGHVRLFSAWDELVDPAAARLLAPTGWVAPENGYPTGAAWIEQYLAPLAAALNTAALDAAGLDAAAPDAVGARPVVRTGVRVTGVARAGRDLLVSADRDTQPFTVHAIDADGHECRIPARAVLDASGTWGSPNPAGADALPALGEHAAAGLLTHRIPGPDDLSEFVGRHTVVVGSGASAFNALATLAEAVRQDPSTRVTWVLRRPVQGSTFGGGAADQLRERGALGLRAKALVDDGTITVASGFRTEAMRRVSDGANDRVVLVAEDGRTLEPADRVVVLTGFRPDLSFLSEVRLDLDPVLQAPRLLAAEIDPNLHSCGSVAATGAADLAQPEANFFVIGAKSYGRAPTFLALTGYEQVRSVAAFLAGDLEAASRVELVLPDTGVCGGAGLYDAADDAGGGCCGADEPVVEPAAEPVRVGAPLLVLDQESTGGCC